MLLGLVIALSVIWIALIVGDIVVRHYRYAQSTKITMLGFIIGAAQLVMGFITWALFCSFLAYYIIMNMELV